MKITRTFLTATALTAGLMLPLTAMASPLSVTSTVGGAPVGAYVANFAQAPVGASGGTLAGLRYSVSNSIYSGIVNGSNGYYARPYLSGATAASLGLPVGPDAANYLSTGTGSVTFLFPSTITQASFTIGSIDAYNSLEFLAPGGGVIGTLTGADMTSTPNGSQGINGTREVVVDSALGFTEVVAYSKYFASEYASVAYGTTAVPEPGSLALLGTGLIGLALVSRRRIKRG